MSSLPQFGPTRVFRDDDNTAHVVVRVAVALSREQLLAALSIGFTEINPDRDAEALTVEETRAEVEGWIAGQTQLELDRYMEQGQLTAYPPEARPVMDALAAAVDRAYPTTQTEMRRQSPRYPAGAVVLDTLDCGEIVTAEPTWCTGHDNEPVVHLADITHNGPHTTTSVATQNGTVDILDAHLTHAPYAQLKPEPHPVVSVRVDIEEDLTAEDGRQVARGLHVAGLRLARLVADAAHLQRGDR